MIQTTLVYLVLTIIMSRLTIIKYRPIFGLSIFSWFGIVLFAIVFGCRYDVGRDYLSYLDNYEYASLYGQTFNSFELGFNAITIFFAKNSFHFSLYFGFIAFLQFALLNLTFKSDNRLRACIIICFMLSCSFLSWMNGLRQVLALSIFIYSINFIIRKELIKYFLSIFIASLFHNSALILFPIYFVIINPIKVIPSVKFQILLFLTAVIVSGKFNNIIFEWVPSIISNLGYSHYKEYNSGDLELGIGYYITLLLNFFIIVDYSRIKDKMPRSFYYFYLLYFIGVVWQQVFLGSIPLGRPNYYFYGLNFIVYGYYLNEYLINTNKLKFTRFIVLVGLLMLIFIGYLVSQDTNTFKYNFYWENV